MRETSIEFKRNEPPDMDDPNVKEDLIKAGIVETARKIQTGGNIAKCVVDLVHAVLAQDKVKLEV